MISGGLPTSEGSSSPAENIDLTPESSSEEDRGLRYDDDDGHGEEGGYAEGTPVDPLLGTGLGQEVYELREGAGRRRRRRRRPDRLDLGGGYYDSTPGDDAGDEDEESAVEDEDHKEGVLLYTAEEEAAVVRKFDRRLVLFVALLYLLSFLDRSSMSVSFSCIFLFSFLSHASFFPSVLIT